MMRLILAMAIFASVAYWQFDLVTSETARGALARPETTVMPLGQTGIMAAMPSVPLESQVERGRITIFVFSGRWCPACRQLERHIRRFVAVRPDVAFKFVETDDRWRSQYNIASVPHIVMFGAAGHQFAADNGSDKSAYQMLGNWMNEESQQAYNARR